VRDEISGEFLYYNWTSYYKYGESFIRNSTIIGGKAPQRQPRLTVLGSAPVTCQGLWARGPSLKLSGYAMEILESMLIQRGS
jgi:hypothetical protein